MKTILILSVALFSLSTEAFAAKSCIPGPSNPGGCMGIPDTLSARETDGYEHEEGRDSGGGGRDSGGTGGTTSETERTE